MLGPANKPVAQGRNDMAASLEIESESGTYDGWVHPHNGYYGGDFSEPSLCCDCEGSTAPVARGRNSDEPAAPVEPRP
jgi:hypothetical protein